MKIDILCKKKILLIGDSIREGYCEYTKEFLSDVADVRFPDWNNRYSQNVFLELAKSMSYFKNPEEIDVVVWNTGHWDQTHWDKDELSLNDLGTYEKMLVRIHKRIKAVAPNAIQIFPLISKFNEYTNIDKRKDNAEVVKYNDTAIKTLKPFGIEFIDHYEFTSKLNGNDFLDVAHLKPDANKELGKITADFIRKFI